MKKPDLLILIAIWEFIAALFTLGIIIFLTLVAFPSVLGMWGNNWWDMWGIGNAPSIMGSVFAISLIILVLVCYLAVAIIGGIGLLLGKEWGRITSLVHNALSLIVIPIGTIPGTLSIIYLAKAEVRDYFTVKPPRV
jgi:hypothetical protein